MRTTLDRIRHAIGFEVIGLLLMIPISKLVFGISIDKSGPMAIGFSLLATVWNYVYNLGYDKLMQRYRGTTEKRLGDRVLHALGFELGLLVVTLPIMAWWLGITLWQALILDLFFVVFYLVYAFVYNWSYDKLFPVASPTAITVEIDSKPAASQPVH